MDAVEEIKQRLSIEDVVGEYVELKRAGRNWKGLSPFSNERTPSFMVSPEKQIWHDFSSGRGGSMFSFVMEMEGVDFRGSLEILARKAGIDLEQFRGQYSGGGGKEKERLYEALEWATVFYQRQLRANEDAIKYVRDRRGFSGETAAAWRLGYSPNTGTALVDFLRSKRFTEHEIKNAGLSAQRYRGLGDMFRGRIMIPLADAQGRIIGFTARLLHDQPNAPKYINTPQTPLYDKSRHVFGLHFAKEAIRRNKFVVVAEGNLDVVTSHQAGIRQVVATAGTALTEAHLKTLSRFTGDIRLSFDADSAGLSATERAIPIASKTNVSLSIITIPSGKDPDELIRQDAATWQQIVTEPQYAVDWLIDRYKTKLDITTALGKREFSDIILAVIRGLKDQVEQEHYLEHISKLIGTSQGALTNKLHQKEVATQPRLKRPAVTFELPDKALAEYIKVQERLLSLGLHHQKLRTVLDPIVKDMFLGGHASDAERVRAFLAEHPEFTGSPDSALDLKQVWDYVKILQLHYEDQQYDTWEPEALLEEAVGLRKTLILEYVKMQKNRITHSLQELGDVENEQQTELIQTDTHLTQLKKTYGGA